MKNSFKKKGLTLVEVVVAMALVIIISFAGFSVINFSLKSGNKNMVYNYFMVEVQNYVTAIMSGSAEYSNSMYLLTGNTYNYGENGIVYYSSELTVADVENAKYHINIKFESAPYSVSCYDSQNNLIFEAEVWVWKAGRKKALP